jgi:hypothetical protein
MSKQVRFIRDTYKVLKEKNPVFSEGVIIFVIKLPWYKSWFGLRPTGLKLSDGVTPFNKLKFI